jgi:two-component SAPR family response regulator
MTAVDLGHPLRGYRVLIVEDHYLVADELRRAVQQLGGEVAGPIPDLAGALDCVERDTVDLALLDINLGEQGIYPAARELLHRKVPFIFATGCESWIIPDEYQGVPRLEKPVTTRALADTIRRLGMQPRP